MASETIQTRVSPELKKNAEALFNALGLSLTDAIRVFLQQSVNEQRLPFQPATGASALSVREAAEALRQMKVDLGDGVEYQRRMRSEWNEKHPG